ncbi:uncharacterized protein [Musca autumnalis]|uniref:uncharacterized protein n=1 Tax=Musca autumnalis TaxID=221902 RepID=UPI003CEF6342
MKFPQICIIFGLSAMAYCEVSRAYLPVGGNNDMPPSVAEISGRDLTATESHDLSPPKSNDLDIPEVRFFPPLTPRQDRTFFNNNNYYQQQLQQQQQLLQNLGGGTFYQQYYGIVPLRALYLERSGTGYPTQQIIPNGASKDLASGVYVFKTVSPNDIFQDVSVRTEKDGYVYEKKKN